VAQATTGTAPRGAAVADERLALDASVGIV